MLAYHQFVYIFNVFSFFIFSFGFGSISKQRPWRVNRTAMGGLFIDFNSEMLPLSRTSNACSAALSLGRATANYFSHSSLIPLAYLTASKTTLSSPVICSMIVSAYYFCILTIYILITVSSVALMISGFMDSRLACIFSTSFSVSMIFEYPFSYLYMRSFTYFFFFTSSCLNVVMN